MLWYYYKGIGGETTINTPLIDNEVDELLRDGIYYRKVTGTPTGKQFQYDNTTGNIIFDASLPPLEVDETVDLSYAFPYLNQSPPDTTPPVISSVTPTSITDTSATITWITDEPTDAQIFYGLTIKYNNSSLLNTFLETSHSIILTSLIPGTTYNYRVYSKDATGNLSASINSTFTTTGTAPAPDTTAPIISVVIVSSITTTGATITWTTDENATSQVQYGLTTNYGTQTIIDTNLVTSHSIVLTGLATNTAYNFRVRSMDAANNLAISVNSTFTTAANGIISPHFGANHQGLSASNTIIFADSSHLNIGYIRDQEILSIYAGGSESGLDTLLASGKKLVLNINWGAGVQPRTFPTNEAAYRSKLALFLSVYGANIEVAVIENEPTNQNYYNQNGFPGTYLNELGWAVAECNNAGVKVTDGAIHIENFQDAPVSTTAIINQYLDGLHALNMDYCNFHFHAPDQFTSGSGTNEAYKPGFISRVVNYIKQRGGHPVMTNEYHQELSANGLPNPSLTKNLVRELKLAGVIYSIAFTGDGTSNALPFCDLNTIALTTIGDAYRQEIALP